MKPIDKEKINRGDIIKVRDIATGRFLIMRFIDRLIEKENNDDTELLYGVWLLTNVKHLMRDIGLDKELVLVGEEDIVLYEDNDFDTLMVDLL